jgi:alpha-ketoglutarate-dependent 2,4-dichlorophenoxyacetate dioxygenase
MSITLYSVTPDFVAEVGDVDLAQPLAADDLATIKDAFRKYAVLVFPAQQLVAQQHTAFAQNFGPLESNSERVVLSEKRRNEDLVDVANITADGRRWDADSDQRFYQAANRLWHTDSSFKQRPAYCSLLYARTVAPIGGHTEFADQRAAYDALPATMKVQLQHLIAEHSIATSRLRSGFMTLTAADLERKPPVLQRVVRTLPDTGRKTLYVASHAAAIVGMPAAEGRDLVDALIAHVTQRQFVYTHRWRQCDLVMWDNRCTMHRGTDYDDLRWSRDMQRATVSDIGNTCEQDPVAVSA